MGKFFIGVDRVKICSVEGCNNRHKAKGYCNKHYAQFLKHGKILERTRFDKNEIVLYDEYAEIILYNYEGEEINRALIDIEDVEKVFKYKWRVNDNGYVVTDINKTTKLRLHRFLMNPNEDMVVDHINHNRLDNRKQNLRICTQGENLRNKKVKGVVFDKRRNKWYARIMINGKNLHLGSFATEEEAIKVRRQAEIKYFKEYKYEE